MADDTIHPNVAFATKYGDPTGDYLNAYTALARLETLIEDANKVSGILDAAEPTESRWFPWYGSEVISYYAVGFVTCLEWHARSRLADLFGYAPASLEPADLKGQVSDKVMVQLLTQGASVANLISASTTVGSFPKYMTVMNRVLASVGCSHDAYTCVKADNPATGTPWLSAGDLEALDRLFAFRNELTHEIGRSVVGHMNVRDGWSPVEAVENGTRVKHLMMALERCIARHAPDDFPNLLDEEGYPVWRITRLNAEIEKLEFEMTDLVQRIEWGEHKASLAQWQATLAASRLSLEAEHTFIENAPFLHPRYLSLAAPLHIQLASARFQYLKLLLKHSNMLWADNPDAEGVSEEQPD